MSYSLAQTAPHLKTVDELSALEDQQEVARHLQVHVDKPCVTAYFAGRAWPEVGERGNRFYALVAELKRVGLNEETATNKMVEYFNKCPESVLNAPASDGRPFALKELESIVKSAYKRNDVKSYGCSSGMWDSTCIGPEMCEFKKRLSNGNTQSRDAALYYFLSLWMGAKKADGKKLLNETDIRTYLALEVIEKKRGYKPGTLLFVSWREIASFSGLTVRKTGPALENLFWLGLISYQKGHAQERGTASEIKRIIPVPHPSGLKVMGSP